LTRNGLAWLVALLGGVALLAFLLLAIDGRGTRLDTFLLVVATIVHFIALVAWWFARWTPTWIVAGYGLVLASSGLGFLISSGSVGGAMLAFYGMGSAGLLTIIAAALDRGPRLS
jgi:hypothetical protein